MKPVESKTTVPLDDYAEIGATGENGIVMYQ